MSIQQDLDRQTQWARMHPELSAGQQLLMRAGQPGGYGTAAGATAASGDGSSEEFNRAKMYQLLSGRLADLKGDPLDAAISQQLMGRINGTSKPYDETTTNAYFTNATDQAAASAQAAAGRLHGNPADPSYQAALREIEAGRAGAGQQARLSIDMNAGLANYNAQGQAMAQGGAWNGQRNAAITDQSNRYADTLGRQTFTHYTPQTGGSFGGWQSFNSNPAYQVQTYMPQPAPQPTQGGGGLGDGGWKPVWDASGGANDAYWSGGASTHPTNPVSTTYNPAPRPDENSTYQPYNPFAVPPPTGYRGGLPQGDARGTPYNPFPRPTQGY
jgi:hypothetical protein